MHSVESTHSWIRQWYPPSSLPTKEATLLLINRVVPDKMPNVTSVAAELREMEKLLLDVFLLDESRLFPLSSAYPPLPWRIREDGGRVIIVVSCGPDIAFTRPVSSAAARKGDLIRCDLFCFRGFWKKNKVVEFCGLTTAHGLGCSKSYELWGCCSRTAFYYFFSFILSFRINHQQLMLFLPPSNSWNLFNLLFSLFLTHVPSKLEKNSRGRKFLERLVFSLAFVTWLDVVLVTPGTPENTDWQLSLECSC